jgi:hypothetical protein
MAEAYQTKILEEKGKAVTWRSFSALLFAAAVVQPLIIYLTLVGSEGLITLSLINWGGGLGLGYSLAVFTSLGGQILWLIVLLWGWLARSFGRELSVGETFIIYAFYPVTVSTAILFILPVFRLYIANSIIIEALGLAPFIPSWWAPRGVGGLLAYSERNLFSSSMFLPTLLTIAVTVLTYICDIALGLFAYQRYAVVEKLTFPAASSYARGILVLAGVEPKGKHALMAGAAIGIFYGLFSWLIPSLTGIPVLQLFPRGITDFTYLIEGRYPGASFGVDFSWVNLVTGFVVPLKILATIAITSLLAYSVGNAILVSMGIWPDWAPKYGLGWNFARSHLYWWTSVTIGLSLAAAFIPLILHPRRIVRILSPSMGSSVEGKGRKIGLGTTLILIFLGSSLAGVLLFHILIPEFPIALALLFVVGWSFFATMVGAHASGVTFGGLFVPYAKESMIYYSGYTNPEAWFGKDFLMLSQGGTGHVSSLKMASMCGVSIAEYIKGFVIAASVGLCFGFLYVTAFWKTAPIPSYIYKFTITGWPIMALETARWTKWLWTGIIFKTDVILASALLGAVIVAISDLFLGAPWLLISIIAGINSLPSSVLMQFVGGLLGQFLARSLGRERWREIAPLVVVGVVLGDGVIIALGSAISIISQSLWSLPY